MEKRIILFLVLSMALIVLYPYVMDKMGLVKRPQPVRPQKDSRPASPEPPPSTSVTSQPPEMPQRKARRPYRRRPPAS